MELGLVGRFVRGAFGCGRGKDGGARLEPVQDRLVRTLAPPALLEYGWPMSGWLRRRGWMLWFVGMLVGPALLRADSPMRTPTEYEVLRSFPPGRLAVLTANDMPDAQGLTGGNRGVGKWIEAGAQRGSCRAVIAAVVAGDQNMVKVQIHLMPPKVAVLVVVLLEAAM